MKKDKKRQAVLIAKSQTESLEFQTMWGAKQKYHEITPAIEEIIKEELQVFNNLNLADDLLTLKNAIETFIKDLAITSEPSKGILAGSTVAYCLNIEPTDPFAEDVVLNPLDFHLPLYLTISYDNEIRNNVVDWLKAHGYQMTTYLGQPLLRLSNTRVIIRRVVKQ